MLVLNESAEMLEHAFYVWTFLSIWTMDYSLPGQRGHPERSSEKFEAKWSKMVFCCFTKVSYSREWYARVQRLTLQMLSFCYILLITLL